MKLPSIGRIAIAVIPITMATLGLTAGSAAAAPVLPRDPCQTYAEQVDDYYGQYRYWYYESMSAFDAGNPDRAIDYAEIAVGYRAEYERALNDAFDFGCF